MGKVYNSYSMEPWKGGGGRGANWNQQPHLVSTAPDTGVHSE
jgi:hypothetical protein